MIHFQNGGRLVESLSELPNFGPQKYIYADFETSSGDPKKTSLNPWKNCYFCGIAITTDDAEGAWYVPIGHEDTDWNLPAIPVLEWLQDVFDNSRYWVNHNVKYDAIVAHRSNIRIPEMICTLALAKIIDSDKIIRGGYKLSALSRDWLDEEIDGFESKLKGYLEKCKDYGRVPADIMGAYACQDAMTVRKLWKFEQAMLPPMCQGVWETEQKLTNVLFDMEIAGLHVNPEELQVEQFKLTTQLLAIEEKIHKASGQSMRPHVNDDCFDYLCNMHGLPVLGWTDEGNPSFDKHTLGAYLRHPFVVENELLTTVIGDMLSYRKKNTLLSLFVETFLDLHVDGVIHPSYNQSVRTARMSCKMPNAQQQTGESKELVHPAPGKSFLSADYSQVEFRLIVHYTKTLECIKAYAADPTTDFHQWVADMCGIPRSPAKNINFAIGYGAGKAKVLAMLSSNVELVGDLMAKAKAISPDNVTEAFERLALTRATEVFRKYHATLSGLKLTATRAANAIKNRGYIFNAYGRQRHLPAAIAYRAFNGLIQGTAADLMKERTVAASPRYNEQVRSWGVSQVANVHDELLFEGDPECWRDPAVTTATRQILESPSVSLRVPILVDMGVSDRNWKEASSGDIPVAR
jgi:DNA polymerase I